MSRLSRGDLFMAIAQTFALRSTCTRGHVGAVIVMGKHIVAHGYNGAPANMPECLDVGCDVQYGENMEELGCQRAIHAEANAVAFAAKMGVSCHGATIFSTHEPCRKCAELIIQSGIKYVYYAAPYRRGAGKLLAAAGVKVERHLWVAEPPSPVRLIK